MTLSYSDLPLLRQGERIETPQMLRRRRRSQQISPCFGKGSGLKQQFCESSCQTSCNLPVLRQGERIETLHPRDSGSQAGYLPLLRQGERIETLRRRRSSAIALKKISPCFGKGSGLKLENDYGLLRGGLEISPCFGKGSGLKLYDWTGYDWTAQISPCFGKGSGLKHTNLAAGSS